MYSIGEGNGTPLQYSCLENPWTEEPGRLQSMGSLSRTRLSDFTFTFHFSLSYIGEGNGNPLQCSCLENPRDGGAWWAAIYGVTQSQTRLKRLSSSSSSSVFNQFSSVAKSCLSLCNPMDCSTPGFPVHDQLPELAHTHVRGCHPTILSSVVPFSFCLQSCPASGCFQVSQFFTSDGQSIGVLALLSVLPMSIQD